MLIVSFDIGIVNLGVCVMLGNRIIVWRVIKLYEKMKKNISISELADVLYINLDMLIDEIKGESEGVDSIDYVLLENQPSKGVLKTIQTLIYGYFHNLKHYDRYVLNICHVNASLKLKGLNDDENVKNMTRSERYRNTKNRSIEICKELINGIDRLENIFSEYKKCDDIADAMNQTIGFIKQKKLFNVDYIE